MSVPLWGSFALDGPRRTLEISHHFAADPDTLWAALTTPEGASRWIGPLTITGREYDLGFNDFGDVRTRGRIETCAEPSRLKVTWKHEEEPPSGIDIRLTAADGGTRLTMIHRDLQAVGAAEYGAGWQGYLAELGRSLGQEAPPTDFGALLARYRTAEAALVPGAMSAGELPDGRRGHAVHLERRLGATTEEVWSALTTAERLSRWLWEVVEWPGGAQSGQPLAPGSEFATADENMPSGRQRFSVRALTPGADLVLGWHADPGETSLRFALAECEGGTNLSVDQGLTADVEALGAVQSAASFAAGWHALLDRLTCELAGAEIPDQMSLWEAALGVYAPVR